MIEPIGSGLLKGFLLKATSSKTRSGSEHLWRQQRSTRSVTVAAANSGDLLPMRGKGPIPIVVEKRQPDHKIRAPRLLENLILGKARRIRNALL